MKRTPARKATWKLGAGLTTLALCMTPYARAESALTQMLACRNVVDATQRLACFDRESARAAGAPASPAAPPQSASASRSAAISQSEAVPQSATASPSQTLDAGQRFGLPEKTVEKREVAAGTRTADASRIQAHISRLSTAADGREVFTLDNDQVWQQVSPEGDLLAKSGETVTLSRALLGSFWLETEHGRGCKVKRIR